MAPRLFSLFYINNKKEKKKEKKKKKLFKYKKNHKAKPTLWQLLCSFLAAAAAACPPPTCRKYPEEEMSLEKKPSRRLFLIPFKYEELKLLGDMNNIPHTVYYYYSSTIREYFCQFKKNKKQNKNKTMESKCCVTSLDSSFNKKLRADTKQ